MANLTVGPNSDFPTIDDAMLAANAGDSIFLEAGYSNETATVTHNGMTVSGQATSTGIVLQLGNAITTLTLAGGAPIDVLDAPDGNTIVGNDGDNLITVTGGVDAVNGGLGVDRLRVDYSAATGAITGDSTSNFSEAGGGGRTVTITDGTFENFTVLTGSGGDTLTVGNGNNTIRAGNGANTITAGQGANSITGGSNADTITAGDGGNLIDGGDGTNAITSGAGTDVILSGTGADTIVAGGGNDRITVLGGSDTVDSGAGNDRLIIDYSALTTAVIGGVTGGNELSGYTGHIADVTVNVLDFVATESFTIKTGSGNDEITTGGGNDTLSSGIGNDLLRTGAGNDSLKGDAGNDRLVGGADADVLDGGAGSDSAYYSDAAAGVLADLQTVSNNTGIAAGDTYTSVENLVGSDFDDSLRGDVGDNAIRGGSGNDKLYGRAGTDSLYGGEGDDRLVGSSGDDTLSGGSGNDTFVFQSAFDAANIDTIVDFSVADDTMLLDRDVFSALSNGAVAADAFFIGTSAQDADDRVIYNSATGATLYDADGSGGGAAVQFATLGAGLALTQNDFFVI